MNIKRMGGRDDKINLKCFIQLLQTLELEIIKTKTT